MKFRGARRFRIPRGGSAGLVLDQGLYSVSNFLLQVVVLRASTTRELAAFSVGYAAYWIVTGSARGLFGESQLVLAARGVSARAATPPASWVVAYCVLGLLPGAVVAYAVRDSGLLVAGSMALSAPVGVVADYLRYALMVRGRTRRLIGLDSTWLTLQAVASAVLMGWSHPHPAALVLTWALAAVVACLVFCLRLDLAWRSRWPSQTGRGMAGEFLVTSGIQQLLSPALYGIGAVGALAALRAAQTLVSPLNTVFTAGTTTFYGRMRHARQGPLVLGVQLGVVLLGVVGLYGVALAFAPSAVVRNVFGKTALSGLSIVLIILFQVAANGVVAGGVLSSRLLRSPRENFVSRVITAPFVLLAPLLGVFAWGSEGLAWGLFVGSVLTAIVWWAASVWAASRAGDVDKGAVGNRVRDSV